MFLTSRLGFTTVFFILFVLQSTFVTAQFIATKQDHIRGKLTPLRSCFNVTYQDITVKINPTQQSVIVNNNLSFITISDCKKIQLDLAEAMHIDSVLFLGKLVPVERDSNIFFITFPFVLKKGTLHTISMFASGKPQVAKKAPWDGGFVWRKDQNGKHWVGLACEGIGASCWLPCKDHWSDEADSVSIHLQVPSQLMGVSNGKIVGTNNLENGYTQFDWEVRNPINNYNISINVGDYAHIADSYFSKPINPTAPLLLDYYVLKYNKETAETHFKQVHKMLEAFEYYFGKYPFANDGYKLVETPYWGMEHQSCVAYGNDYKNNKWGFDFIIVHESGHEWFGNSLTANDAAEMWIHEGFTTYSEALFVEYYDKYPESVKYLLSQQANIENIQPLIGPFDVNFHARTDNDIYYKGAWILHTLRSSINNDTLWFNALKDFCTTFAKSNLTTADIVQFFSKRISVNLKPFFQQYLFEASLPTFEYKIETSEDGRMVMRYRWINVVKGFEMPIQVTVTKGKFETITPRKGWQLIDLNYFDEANFKIKPNSYIIKIRKIVNK